MARGLMFNRKRREREALLAQKRKFEADLAAACKLADAAQMAHEARIIDQLDAEMRWQHPSEVPLAERLSYYQRFSRGVQPMPSITRVRVANQRSRNELRK